MHPIGRRIRSLITLGALAFALAAPTTASTAAATAGRTRYAAIAIDTTNGSWGTSVRALRRRAAEREAQRRCPGACRVLVWVRRQCAAAVETSAAYWGGFGPTYEAALRNARRRARDRKAQFVAWTCSD